MTKKGLQDADGFTGIRRDPLCLLAGCGPSGLAAAVRVGSDVLMF